MDVLFGPEPAAVVRFQRENEELKAEIKALKEGKLAGKATIDLLTQQIKVLTDRLDVLAFKREQLVGIISDM